MAEHEITRKDFLNATLLGVGAALLRAPAPLESMVAGTGAAPDHWTGPGGAGDYASSNANTRAVMEVVARGYGRIAIGHSELNGHQSATGAMAQGKRLGEWAADA